MKRQFDITQINTNKKRKNTEFIRSLLSVFIGAILVFSVFIGGSVHAAINERINYQGKLTDTSGVAVTNGDYRMKFNLYTVETGGSTIWTEDRSANAGDRVTITSGLFSVMLGSSTALSNVDFNQTLYLGVEICGLGSGVEVCDGEMTPRKMIGSVPSAFESKKLSGIESWQFLRSDIENSTSTASSFLRITQSGAGNIADFIGQSSASVLTVLSSNQVAVGTSTPYARFTVWGGGTGTGVLANFVNNASTSIMTLLDNGNVGIGTTSPYAKLSVAGQTVAEYFTATSNSATSTLPFLSVTSGLSTPLSANSVAFIAGGGMLSEDNSNFTYTPSGGLTVQDGLNVSTSNDVYSQFGESLSKLGQSDNIDRLVSTKSVTGTAGTRRALGTLVQFSGSSDNSGTNIGFQSIAFQNGAGAITSTTGPGGLSGGRIGIALGNSTPGNVALATGLSIYNERNLSALNSASITELIGLQIEGAVIDNTTITDYSGIRMKEPSGTPLNITNLYGLRIDAMDIATNNWAVYTDGTTPSYFGGNVGIGTTTAYADLSVWGAGTGSSKIFELINNASTTVFSVAEDGTTSIGATTAGNIVFQTSTSGDIVLVGIGTTTPDADLAIVSDQVNSNTYLFTVATTTGDVIDRRFTVDSDGDIAYDGTATTPADYAEAFGVVGSKENYEPGDIVVTSKKQAGKVEKSNTPYQSNIAGVYSTKPGILGTLAEDVTSYQIKEENDIAVGIMGRVPTKVSIENGLIEVGDYITSSTQRGVGMKATKPGKVVGVALESFDESGVDKIMVFLNDSFYFGEGGLNLESRILNLEAFLQSGGSDDDQNPFQRFLDLIGVKIKDGLAYFTNIITERLTIGSKEKPSGITIFDESTGEPYCLSIKRGDIISKKGECKVWEDPKPDVISSGEEISTPPPSSETREDEVGSDDTGNNNSENQDDNFEENDDSEEGGGNEDNQGNDSDEDNQDDNGDQGENNSDGDESDSEDSSGDEEGDQGDSENDDNGSGDQNEDGSNEDNNQ